MPTKKKTHKKKQRGGDFFGDVDKFFRDSHIISNIGSVALPALGGFVGSFADPFVGPAGTVVGGVAGQSANDWIRNQGYGKKGRKTKGGSYLGAVPIHTAQGGSRFPPEYVGRLQGGGTLLKQKKPQWLVGGGKKKHSMRGSGIGYTATFGTISSDRGTPNF